MTPVSGSDVRRWRNCAARLLYFDRQYNDTVGLMHEAAHDGSVPLELDGGDPGVLEALDRCLGDTQRLRGNIASAVRIVEANSPG